MLTKTLFKERKPAPMGAHRVLPPLTLFIAVNAAPLPAIASHVQGGLVPSCRRWDGHGLPGSLCGKRTCCRRLDSFTWESFYPKRCVFSGVGSARAPWAPKSPPCICSRSGAV